MRKPAAYLFAMLVGAIVWFFFQHFRVEGMNLIRVLPKTEEQLNTPDAVDSPIAMPTENSTTPGGPVEKTESEPSSGGLLSGLLARIRGNKESDPGPTVAATEQPVGIKPTATTAPRPTVAAKPQHAKDVIRIASFHLHHFGSQASDPAAIDVVAQVVRYFDIVALQGISPGGSSAVVELARRAGSDFEAILGSPSAQYDEHFAYIFNRQTIIADRGDGLYALGDPDNLFLREPLIGWFRAKAASAEEAFTFTLVNVNTEARRAQQELNVLDNAVYFIRNDGRDEDDVITLGSFQAANDQLGELGRLPRLVTAIHGATNLQRNAQTENILFQHRETDEYTGSAGVFTYYNERSGITLEQATVISDYLPVWAEFSIYEGGRKTIARRP